MPLGDGEEPEPAPLHVPAVEDEQPVTGITSPIAARVHVTAGAATARYLDGLGEGKIIGARAPSSDDVYAALARHRSRSPASATTIEVEVQDSGVITTFCVVNIPGLSELAPPRSRTCRRRSCSTARTTRSSA